MKIKPEKIIFFVLLLLINSLPLVVLSYQLLEPSVLLNKDVAGQEVSLADYLRGAYLLLFVITITVAIIALIIHGIKLMTTDIPGVKITSKISIGKALGGLFIALTSYLILNLINPELVSFSKLNLPGIQ